MATFERRGVSRSEDSYSPRKISGASGSEDIAPLSRHTEPTVPSRSRSDTADSTSSSASSISRKLKSLFSPPSAADRLHATLRATHRDTELAVAALRKEEAAIREGLPPRLRELRELRQPQLVPERRTVAQLALALCRARLERAERAAHLRTQQALADGAPPPPPPPPSPAQPETAPPPTDGEAASAAAAAHAETARALEALEVREAALARRHAAAVAHRDGLARAADALRRDARGRGRKLRAVLGRVAVVFAEGEAAEGGVCLHADDGAEQAAFEEIVCCGGAREGRLMRRWSTLLAERCAAAASGDAGAIAPPSSTAVVDFCEYIGRLAAATHLGRAAAPAHLRALELMTARLLLPPLEPPLAAALAAAPPCAAAKEAGGGCADDCGGAGGGAPSAAARDATFRSQQRWMRSLPPSAFGIDARFCAAPPAAASDAEADVRAPARGAPFGAAVAALSDLGYTATPADALLVVRRAVRLLHHAAARAARVSPQSIDADALLPLLCFACVHAELPAAFTAVDAAKRLAPPPLLASELGYHLACLEAALTYIADATRDRLRPDAGDSEARVAARLGADALPAAFRFFGGLFAPPARGGGGGGDDGGGRRWRGRDDDGRRRGGRGVGGGGRGGGGARGAAVGGARGGGGERERAARARELPPRGARGGGPDGVARVLVHVS